MNDVDCQADWLSVICDDEDGSRGATSRACESAVAGAELGPERWLLGISPEGIGAVGALVAFAVLAGVSLLSPPPPREVQDLVASLRYPREAQGPRR